MIKKILCLFALFLLLGCDDGDMAFETFDFSNQAQQACDDSGLIFKINQLEVLLLNIEPSNFPNAVTPPEGRIVTLNGTSNSVVYRNYSGVVTADVLCSNVPPATPTVLEEYLGDNGGTLRIITTERRDEQNVLQGYDHQITLVSVKFNNGESNIIINDNNFGVYSTPVNYTFNFGDEENEITVQKCNSLVYKVNANESLVLQLDSLAFPNVVGNREVSLNATNDNNDVYFDVYSATVSTSSICDAVAPITPVINNRYTATSGKLKIETTLTDTIYTHKIFFSDVIFTNTNSSGEVIRIGQSADYLFGTYTPE